MKQLDTTKNKLLNQAEVTGTVSQEGVIGGVGKAVVQYIKVDEYTTFSAEYGMKDKNLVIHFFLPPEQRPSEGARGLLPDVSTYWLKLFPPVLDAVARNHFQADAPRLQAAYTEELHSWWFLAQGYDHLIDLHKYVLGFLEKLDRALEARPS